MIDVHGQHEHQSLLNEKKHLEVLDAFCGDKLQAVKQELGAAYAAYREKEKLVKEALDEDGSKDREIALARFELEEIEAAALIEGEDEKLEADFRRMENSRQIGESLSQADACLNSYEQENARDLIGAAAKCVSDAAKYDASLAPCVESFAQVQELLQDIGRSLGHYIESMEFDAQIQKNAWIRSINAKQNMAILFPRFWHMHKANRNFCINTMISSNIK